MSKISAVNSSSPDGSFNISTIVLRYCLKIKLIRIRLSGCKNQYVVNYYVQYAILHQRLKGTSAADLSVALLDSGNTDSCQYG